MKVVVCISYIPDTSNEIKLSPDKKSIEKKNLIYILNPFDEFAIEESLKLKEKFGAEIIAVTFGTILHKEAIKRAYSYGIDKGVLILLNSDDFDSFSVAKNLAEVIKEINPDIIFLGKESIDYNGISIHGMLSELLNIPSVNIVTKIEYNNDEITVERDIDDGKERITLKLPVIIGTQKGLNIPRYPKLKDVLASKTKPIEERNAYYIGNRLEISELKISQSKAQGKIIKSDDNCITEIVKFLKEEIKIL